MIILFLKIDLKKLEIIFCDALAHCCGYCGRVWAATATLLLRLLLLLLLLLLLQGRIRRRRRRKAGGRSLLSDFLILRLVLQYSPYPLPPLPACLFAMCKYIVSKRNRYTSPLLLLLLLQSSSSSSSSSSPLFLQCSAVQSQGGREGGRQRNKSKLATVGQRLTDWLPAWSAATHSTCELLMRWTAAAAEQNRKGHAKLFFLIILLLLLLFVLWRHAVPSSSSSSSVVSQCNRNKQSISGRSQWGVLSSSSSSSSFLF